MGYSCTKAAGDVLRTFPRDTEGPSNTWDHKGHRYFWERGREQRDGAVTGTIYREVPPNHACRVGSFRIEPNGTITRAPFSMKERMTRLYSM